jgi:hypothetical protein
MSRIVDLPHSIALEGVSNLRDLGGWPTRDGGTERTRAADKCYGRHERILPIPRDRHHNIGDIRRGGLCAEQIAGE